MMIGMIISFVHDDVDLSPPRVIRRIRSDGSLSLCADTSPVMPVRSQDSTSPGTADTTSDACCRYQTADVNEKAAAYRVIKLPPLALPLFEPITFAAA
jgi:hypothetical protein